MNQFNKMYKNIINESQYGASGQRDLHQRCQQLEETLREIKVRISNIAEECSYEHSPDDPICLSLQSLLEELG
jgi:hypothetical protein